MTLLSIDAQNASLDNDYGATKGDNAPAAHQVAIFTDHPSLGGIELDSVGGYARVVIANDGTTWPAAVDGEKASMTVEFAVPTGEWLAGGVPATGSYWVLIDDADGVTQWDCGRISDEINVTGAGGSAPSVICTIYYGEAAS